MITVKAQPLKGVSRIPFQKGGLRGFKLADLAVAVETQIRENTQSRPSAYALLNQLTECVTPSPSE